MRIFACLAFVLSYLFAAPPQFPEKINDEVFEIFDIEITNLPDSRRLYIAIPKMPASSHNALFLLDANAQFPMALNLYAQLKNEGKIAARNLIIIGFGYQSERAYETHRRSYDYLPKRRKNVNPDSSVNLDSNVNPDSNSNPDSNVNPHSHVAKHANRELPSGGADEFLGFVKSQVKNINARFNIAQSAFFAHSFGGVFCLHYLLNEPRAFNHYICASSALYYGDFFDEFRPKFFPDSITISLGELEKQPNDPREILAKNLRAQNENAVINYIEFRAKTHGESLLDSLAFALRIFE